jgi:hypothetical protein
LVQQQLKVIKNYRSRCITYLFKKEPLKRTYPKFIEPEPIKPLTSEQLKELGITINVDVADCKNFKEASKVQEQIINGNVKINIIKK